MPHCTKKMERTDDSSVVSVLVVVGRADMKWVTVCVCVCACVRVCVCVGGGEGGGRVRVTLLNH